MIRGATVPIGALLAGKYRVERVLGQGGMGYVVAARHLALDLLVAIKFIRDEALADETIARFLREARASARLRSDHVTRVIDVGTLGDGAPYMVMELLDGEDLRRVLAERGPLPINDAVRYMRQACAAMAEAHALGIVHRDLKPENLFLARRSAGEPIIKVLDFGISKLSETNALATGPTRTSIMMGSPAYMSPEQMQSPRDVDARADVWALGVILYELVSGRLPVEAESIPVLCSLVLSHHLTPLHSIADVPDSLASIVDRCLAQDPRARFADAGALAAALETFAIAIVRAAPRPRSVDALAVTVAESSILRRESGGLRIALGVLVVALGVGLGWWALVPSRATTAANDASIAIDAAGANTANIAIDASITPPPIDATVIEQVDAGVDAAPDAPVTAPSRSRWRPHPQPSGVDAGVVVPPQDARIDPFGSVQ